MKTAEEYALEEWTDGDGGYSPYEIAKMAFDAGLAEGKSIWKSPDDMPTMHKIKERGLLAYSDIVTVSKGWVSSERYYYYPSGPTNLGYASHWTYLSDFLKTLPDWAKEVGE